MILDNLNPTTLLDYILWRGDLSFTAAPFRKEDSLILCMFSYLDLRECLSYGDRLSVRDAFSRIRSNGSPRVCFMGRDERMLEILEAAAASDRFGNLFISRYTDILNDADAVQFCAMTFELLPGLRFLSFRGTDSSVAGWKEDFMICFRRTASQSSALHYLQHALADSADDILLGGHSKGANLALYAAAELDPKLQHRIREVYFLDGPGFCPEVLDAKHIAGICEKIIRIVPEHCVIGRLYRPELPHSFIVKSSEIGLMQHDMSSWCIDHGHIAPGEGHSLFSDFFAEAFERYIESIPMEERPNFVEDLFDRISAGGEIKDLDDFETKLPAVLEHLILRRAEKIKTLPSFFEPYIGGKEHE